jgi:hypothetical protein
MMAIDTGAMDGADAFGLEIVAVGHNNGGNIVCRTFL